MKRKLMLFALGTLLTASVEAQTGPQWPLVNREAKPGLRWWWMGSAVDQDNLKWSMEQYAQAGVGTLEITPIYGVKGNTANNISFLSTAWLDMLRYTQQLGEQLDIDVDMTTGTGWPSGGPMVKKEQSASKLVTETFDVTGDGTAEQALTLTTTNTTLQKVMAYPQKGTEGAVTDLTTLLDGKSLRWVAPTGKWKVIAAYNQYEVMKVKRPSPGSEGNVLDYFDAEAVAAYLQYFDNRFAEGGNPWPHSFFNDSYEINQADWTPRMFEQFLQRRGYRLEDNLDLLLGIGNRQPEGLTKKDVVSDYRQTLSDMLRDNFTRQWTQWAHSHGATTRNQAHGSPGNLIDLYAEADIPETENFYMNSFGIKGLRVDKGFYLAALSSKATLKYASSAAHITGKKLTSSESMTWLTEHFRTSLSQIKPELDLLFLSGVNHVLFHGAAYSPREAAWPGWKFYAAIDMSPTNSIWRDAPAMMDYISRVQSFMQMGRPDNDVLVYAPFAYRMKQGLTTKLMLFDINTMANKMPDVETCVKNIEALGLDCDYTSEHYLMSTTYVDGRLMTAAGTAYQALVVPVSTNLPDSVKAHLDELQAQGAEIIYGNTPDALSQLTATPEALRKQLGLGVIRRANDTGHHYFLSNLTPSDVEGFVPLAVPFEGIAFFDPCSGQITRAEVVDGKVWVSLKSGQSILMQTYDTPISLPTVSTPVAEQAGIAVGTKWELSFTDETEPSMAGRSYSLDVPTTWENLDAETARLMGTGIYEATFSVSARQMQSATAGFRLDLGDVRESARVWLNGTYLGCAWSVPYVLDCKGQVREGDNKLRIEVTNLPANRIRQMDIDAMEWRIFEDINMSNISSASYADWSLVPSGLSGSVRLVPLSAPTAAMSAEVKGMQNGSDGHFYLTYSLSLPEGKAIDHVTMTDQKGQPFGGYSLQKADDGSALLTINGCLSDYAIVEATDADGGLHYANVVANGAYESVIAIDFTTDAAPGGGWQKMSSDAEIKGFSGTGKLPNYRSKLIGTEVKDLYPGLTFSCEKAVYYYYYIGYGMNAQSDFTVSVDEARRGDICLVSYLRGEGPSVYVPSDSLLLFSRFQDEAQGLSVSMPGSSNYYVYRSLAVYRPLSPPDAVQSVAAPDPRNNLFYNLQGLRIVPPRKGLYIRNGRKVLTTE